MAESKLDLESISWRFEGFLQAAQLNRLTVMDYFRLSPFFDRQCNNELLRLQDRPQSELRKMRGVEYELDTSVAPGDDRYFLIRKQYREDEHRVRNLALFYIVGVDPPAGAVGASLRGTIFPLPDMQSVFACNLRTAIYYVHSALKDLGSTFQAVGEAATARVTAGPADTSAATATAAAASLSNLQAKYGLVSTAPHAASAHVDRVLAAYDAMMKQEAARATPAS